ncbi:hypothetical protein ST201phi2-1p262 [Pseudomonas phage 201phi2-1]|uniref:Uncharacterized protein n=1 Tax=Pseudomonas phage 201phi2-1 TaxID=198110 RepID=B3FJC4_BP201|nr:hypothetical protein ST201phi2-1p262 [Pseudomonas phage 201phi2-1]ABY63090.1 hypothetical protein 201phi2-1p262 [Pseudomonas phage 201phi2-1]
MSVKLRWQVAAIVAVGSTIQTMAVLYVVRKAPNIWVDV